MSLFGGHRECARSKLKILLLLQNDPVGLEEQLWSIEESVIPAI